MVDRVKQFQKQQRKAPFDTPILNQHEVDDEKMLEYLRVAEQVVNAQQRQKRHRRRIALRVVTCVLVVCTILLTFTPLGTYAWKALFQPAPKSGLDMKVDPHFELELSDSELVSSTNQNNILDEVYLYQGKYKIIWSEMHDPNMQSGIFNEGPNEHYVYSSSTDSNLQFNCSLDNDGAMANLVNTQCVIVISVHGVTREEFNEILSHVRLVRPLS